MNWTQIINAAAGQADALFSIMYRIPDRTHAALATLLLLDDAPHPTTALVVLPMTSLPVQAALAAHVAPALAAWRADPLWPERAVSRQARERLAWCVVGMVVALREHPAAQRDAIDLVLDHGDERNVEDLLYQIGVDGWRKLDADRRDTLLKKAPAEALAWIWTDLNKSQREKAALDVLFHSYSSALFIGNIGDVAWRTTDPNLRDRLIFKAVIRSTDIDATARTWPGMTADERKKLAMNVIDHRDASAASLLLDRLGTAGRATLTDDQRARLESLAMARCAWSVLKHRITDAGWGTAPVTGWGAASVKDRSAALAAAEQSAMCAADLLRTVGAAGWDAMSPDEQERIATVIRANPRSIVHCPPALWRALAVHPLPPATEMPTSVIGGWRAEDVDVDLSHLPPAHRAVLLGSAMWRWDDVAKESVRMQRLCDAWNEMTADERVDVATAHPFVLAAVAAAARRRGDVTAAIHTVGETFARIVAATADTEARRAVAAMLREPNGWRDWMAGFAPDDSDPPEVWTAWADAALRGCVLDPALCARLAAYSSPRPAAHRGARCA